MLNIKIDFDNKRIIAHNDWDTKNNTYYKFKNVELIIPNELGYDIYNNISNIELDCAINRIDSFMIIIGNRIIESFDYLRSEILYDKDYDFVSIVNNLEINDNYYILHTIDNALKVNRRFLKYVNKVSIINYDSEKELRIEFGDYTYTFINPKIGTIDIEDITIFKKNLYNDDIDNLKEKEEFVKYLESFLLEHI